MRRVGLTPVGAFAGLRWAGCLPAWLLELTPYGANGFALAGRLDGDDAAFCFIFKSLCVRFLEGESGGAPLPMVKADCMLAGCLAGAAVLVEPASAGWQSMRKPGLMFAFPVNGRWPARFACCACPSALDC